MNKKWTIETRGTQTIIRRKNNTCGYWARMIEDTNETKITHAIEYYETTKPWEKQIKRSE